MANKKAFKPFNLRIFPAVLLGVICGICSYLLTDTTVVAVIVALAPAAAVVVCFALKRKSAATFFLCVAIGAALGAVGAFAAVRDVENKAFFGEDVIVTARIGSGNASELDGTITGGEIVVDSIVANGVKLDAKGTLVLGASGDLGLKEGDVITFVAKTFSTLPDHGDGFVVSALAEGRYYEIVAVESDSEPNFVIDGQRQDALDKIRVAVADKLSANMREDTAEFVYAMLFGYSDVMSDDISGDFSQTGTAHLLAVSGLHVVMLAAVVDLILRKLRLPQWASLPVSTAVLVGFGALCGFSPSVVRSIVMLAILKLGKAIGGRYDALSSLSLSAAATLIFSPYSLFTLGFLMSYAAVYGIVLFHGSVEKGLCRLHCPKALASAIAVTVAANIGVLPITVQTFGATSLVFLLANLCVMPLVTFAFPVFLAALAISFVPYAGWVLSAVSLFFTAMILIVQACSTLNFATVSFALDWHEFVIYFALLIVISRFSFVHIQSKKILASVLIIGFCVNVVAQSAARWIYPERAICFGTDGVVGAAFVGDDKRAYVAVAGELDYEAAIAVRDALANENVTSLTLAKSTVSEDELYAIAIIFRGYESRLCTTSDVNTTESVPVVVREVADGDVAMFFDGDGTAVLFGGASALIATDPADCTLAPSVDIVVCEGEYAASDGQTVVSDDAFDVFAENSVPSDFTFGVNSGKIKKIAKWRFI